MVWEVCELGSTRGVGRGRDCPTHTRVTWMGEGAFPLPARTSPGLTANTLTQAPMVAEGQASGEAPPLLEAPPLYSHAPVLG